MILMFWIMITMFIIIIDLIILCYKISKDKEKEIAIKDGWVDSLIIELIGAVVIADFYSSEEMLDKEIYQLLRNVGITDDWLKENDWFTGDEIDDCSEDV